MKKILLFPAVIFLSALVSCAKTDATDANDKDSIPSLEIWMGLKTGSTGNWANVDWKVVLPDGSYFNQLPREGFMNFSKDQSGGTWGTFVLNGNTGTFQNQYESLQVKKISDTELEKIGYTNRLYKLAPVDGLELSGKYNTIPNWSTMSNYPYGSSEPQPLISFSQDGTFSDMGVFVTNFSMPNQDPQKAPGDGKYEIKNFTLILNYSDGRIITKAFSGALNNKVTATSELVFIGGNPLYIK